jgi:putative membrane protein
MDGSLRRSACWSQPGLSTEFKRAALAASLVLGILNALIRPVLLIVSLPLVIVTFGLFILVINAVLLYFAGNLVKGFSVAGFWPAFKGALVISIMSVIANMLFGPKRVAPVPQQRSKPPNSDRPSNGPVIDV